MRVSSLSVSVRLVVGAMAAALVGAWALAIESSPGARVLLANEAYSPTRAWIQGSLLSAADALFDGWGLNGTAVWPT